MIFFEVMIFSNWDAGTFFPHIFLYNFLYHIFYFLILFFYFFDPIFSFFHFIYVLFFHSASRSFFCFPDYHIFFLIFSSSSFLTFLFKISNGDGGNELSTIEGVSTAHQRTAVRVPLLSEICLRAVGCTCVHLSEQVALNGGTRPNVRWMQVRAFTLFAVFTRNV